jgi:hypothetical protein
MANSSVIVRLHLEGCGWNGGPDGRHLNAIISATLTSYYSDIEVVRTLLGAWAATPMRVESPSIRDD